MRRLVVLYLLFAGMPLLAAEPDGLLYGQARFAALTEQPLEVLSLLENDHTGATQVDNDFHNENHILAIEAALKLGLVDHAIELSDHLIFTARKARHRDTARLLKARALAYKASFKALVGWLEKNLNHLKGVERDEGLYWLARGYTESGRQADAARALSRITKGSLWAAYGYYNLALKYAQSDPDPSRAWVALRVAAALADQSVEGKALRDRALLVAGNIAMKVEDPEKAAQFSGDVRAEALEAPSAIYLYGMADAQSGRLRTAVRTWHRAKKYALYLPGVAEAFQAIAWAYMQENLKGSAIDAYLEAISVYDKEQQQTRQLMDELKNKGLLELIRAARAEQDTGDWFLNTELVNNTPRVMFVNALMADPEFFSRATDLMRMDDMAHGLQKKRRKLMILEDAYRRASSGSVRTTARKIAALERKLGQLIDRRNVLVEAYKKALADDDFARVGSDNLLQARTRLEDIAASIRSMKNSMDPASYQDWAGRIRQLKGRLIWEEMTGLDDSRKSFKDRIRDIDALIGSMREATARLKGRLKGGRAHFADKVKSIRQLRKKAEQTGQRLDAWVKNMDKVMTEEAARWLASHLERMARFQVKSQLALVNLYDALAVADYAPATVSGGQP